MTKVTRLLALAGLLLTTLGPVAAYSRDGKTDWNYFEEWFMEDKKLRAENKRTHEDSRTARGQRTFWNVRKARGVRPTEMVKSHNVGNDKQKRCVIVFYYPGFWNNRRKERWGPKLSNEDREWAFERPLAMSPMCDPEPKDEDWTNNKHNMIVFHNYYVGPSDHDMYLVIGCVRIGSWALPLKVF
jgi:hypothetical protein